MRPFLPSDASHRRRHRDRYARTGHPPDPLTVSWQGRRVGVHHDDPRLGPYTPLGAVIRSAMELAADVEGLRLYLVTALGDRYTVRVADDGSVIGLWRRG